jgi:Fic family protein
MQRPEPTASHDEVAPLEDQRLKSARDLILMKGPVSRKEFQTVWGLGRNAAAKEIEKQVKNGFLVRIGKSRNTKYGIADR